MTVAHSAGGLPLHSPAPVTAILTGAPVTGAPRTYRVLFLLIALPLFFSVGRYIPITKWTLELGIVLAIGAALFAGVGARPAPRSSFNTYIMLIAFGLPVLGAFSAYVMFGQPMLYGLATQRGCLLALFAYATGKLIANGRLSLAEFERAFVILAWINLAICAPALILLDPNNYSDLGALVSDGGGVFNEFHLPMTFIIFGAMYYVSLWVVSDRAKHGAMALPFILYVVAGNNGRILNIALILALMMIAWIGSPHKRIRNIFGAIVLAIVVILIVGILNPDKIGAMILKYQDAFAAVSGAYDVADISANARIIQTEIAWPYILTSPIIGTGAVSNEWNGGYQHMFGYFHPSDLGIIGLAFVYGIIGVALFSVQYVIYIKLVKYVVPFERKPYGALLLAVTANLGFMLFSSVVTGSFILIPEQTLFFFAFAIAQIQLSYQEGIS